MRFALLTLLTAFYQSAWAGDIDQAAALSRIGQPGTLLIDVRTPDEFADGALPGAINIPHDQLAARISQLTSDKQRPIVLYCRSGRRSGLAQDSLQSLGYEQVINGGGVDALQSVQHALQEGSECTKDC